MKRNNIFSDYNMIVADYSRKFENLRNDYNKIFVENYSLIENRISIFANDYLKLLNEKIDQNLYYAWDFSIFDIVKIKRPEENLHSPLLAELLNPHGKHGQQDLFYKLFIRSFLPDNEAIKFINENYQDYFLKKEEHIDSGEDIGRIDIFIKSTNHRRKFAIIIENKWNSGDSCPDQLYKYYIALTKRQDFNDQNILVFYLTRHGNNPEWVENIEFERFLTTNKNKNYFAISYKNHIYKWLSECQKYCKSEKINFTIEQYKNHIL